MKDVLNRNLIYQNGKFYDKFANEEIVIHEDAQVILITKRVNVDIVEIHELIKKALDKGVILVGELSLPNSKKLIFEFEILEDLYFKKEKSNPPVAEKCPCRIIKLQNPEVLAPYLQKFEPLEVESLNQVYFQMSLKFRPDKKSHSIDIYHNFRMKNENVTLHDLRLLLFENTI